MIISEALRLLRVYSDLNQKGLANRLGLSRSYLCQLESGDRLPTLEVLNKYAKAFDVPLSSILYLAEGLAKGPTEKANEPQVESKILIMLEVYKLNKLKD
jgi:transcriptional regulator with XRE-family HTH domain